MHTQDVAQRQPGQGGAERGVDAISGIAENDPGWDAVGQGATDLLFGDLDDLEIIGQVANGEEALDAIERLQPEIVLMDVRLPGIDGVSAVKRIHQAAPSVKFVMFSAYGDKRLLSDAIAAGARGYVMKGSPPEDLLRAIRTVAEGKASSSTRRPSLPSRRMP